MASQTRSKVSQLGQAPCWYCEKDFHCGSFDLTGPLLHYCWHCRAEAPRIPKLATRAGGLRGGHLEGFSGVANGVDTIQLRA
jgi:hypothetical protein